MDMRCQEVVQSYMQRHFADHVLLAEEDVPPGSEASKEALALALENSEWYDGVHAGLLAAQ